MNGMRIDAPKAVLMSTPKSGRPLAFSLMVNHVPVQNIDQDVLQVFQVQSSIAAMLCRDY
jgi:D-alanyl-D-alanine carboxypeptidase